MAMPFDPSRSVAFDLNRGQITLKGGAERVLVPSDALLALCTGSGREESTDFGRRLGTEAGRRAAERLGDIRSATPEEVVEHLGAELALAGLGSLSLEQWGRSLVFMVTGSPFGAAGDELLASVLQGALQRAFARDADVVRLERDDRRARFLITNHSGAEQVRGWISQGTAWGEALARLDSGRGAS